MKEFKPRRLPVYAFAREVLKPFRGRRGHWMIFAKDAYKRWNKYVKAYEEAHA